MNNATPDAESSSRLPTGASRSFRSIKTKILALIIAILVATSLVMVLFTQREVDIGMTALEEQSARNFIRLSMLNLNSSYNDLVFYRRQMLENRKNELKDILSIGERLIRIKMREVQQGRLTLEAAQKDVLESFRELTYGNNDYIWISDYSSRLISHPDPKLFGADYSQVRDVRGNLIVPVMVEAARQNGEGVYSYWWRKLDETEPSEKLTYFKHVPEWHWVIGTGVYIDEIEKQSQKKMDAMIRGLSESLAKIRIAQTGYMYIFDGKKKMIIHPTLAGKDMTELKNPSTGHPLTEDLIRASATPDEPFEYSWDKPTDPGNYRYVKESYVEYFAPLDWYVVSTVYQDEIKQPARMLIVRQVSIVFVILLASLGIAFLLVVRISSPLKKLSQYAKELPTHNLASAETYISGIEDFPAKFHDEVGRLAESFIFMEHSLKDYVRKLTETTAAKERIESELSIAHDIQMGLVPKTFPAFPSRKDLDLYGVLEPAREVGGDFYDFFLLDDNRMVVAIGDVSGKGVPAALFMAVTRSFLRSAFRSESDPAAVVAHVNEELGEGNDTCMFVTLFCAVFDLATGRLQYANAGHNPPAIRRRDGRIEWIVRPRGLIAGAMPGAAYEDGTVTLGYEDVLVLYTDGVIEAMNPSGALYGEARVIASLADPACAGTCRELIEKMFADIRAFAEGADQSDDITLLVVKRREVPTPAAKTAETLEFSTDNDLASIQRAMDEVDARLESRPVSDKRKYLVRLVLDELLSNIIKYAYDDQAVHRISLKLETGVPFAWTIVDDGKPFNPLIDAPKPVLEGSLEDRPVGGLGLHLLRKLDLRLDYRREQDRNVLRVVFPEI